MKRLLALALCALFACQAEARTIYVNAKRPNNKGNGLSVKKAKKTIQAAINIARKGDTILVYPGTYTPIKTNNLKIRIKSVKGQSKTKIVPSAKWTPLVDCSRHVIRKVEEELEDGWFRYKRETKYSMGMSTTITGFRLDVRNKERIGLDSPELPEAAILSVSLKSCVIRGFHGESILYTRLTDCVLSNNYFSSCGWVENNTFLRCRIKGNGELRFERCKLFNCLVAENDSYCISKPFTDDSLFINCTIIKNGFTLAYDSQPYKNCRYYNCILWNNRSRREWSEYNWKTDDYVFRTGQNKVHNIDDGNSYKNTEGTNRNPKFVSAAKGNYKLTKGSYCIDAGKLTKAQKKLVGTKDLAGRKRIRGKAIDRGCYEY